MNGLESLLRSLTAQRNDAARDEQRYRDSLCSAAPSARPEARLQHWHALDKLSELDEQIGLARKAVAMIQGLEAERRQLSQAYEDYRRQPKFSKAVELEEAHKRLARNEARLRRLTRTLVESYVPASWTRKTRKQFEDDEALLEDSTDAEGWLVYRDSQLAMVH